MFSKFLLVGYKKTTWNCKTRVHMLGYRIGKLERGNGEWPRCTILIYEIKKHLKFVSQWKSYTIFMSLKCTCFPVDQSCSQISDTIFPVFMSRQINDSDFPWYQEHPLILLDSNHWLSATQIFLWSEKFKSRHSLWLIYLEVYFIIS